MLFVRSVLAPISSPVVVNAFGTNIRANDLAPSSDNLGHSTSANHSLQLLTNKAGNLKWAAQYGAYGKAIVQTTASARMATADRLRESCQYSETKTGLHYNAHRYFDADTREYVSRDPIGFEGGINLYGFEIDV